MDQTIVPKFKRSDHSIKLTIYQTICILHVPYRIYYGAIAFIVHQGIQSNEWLYMAWNRRV